MAPVTRSRRVGIIAAAVVVALVAVGVVVYLSTKGSGSTSSSTQTTVEVVDPPVTAPPPRIAPLAISDKMPSTAGIEAQLAAQLGNPDLAQFSGVIIDPESGTVLWNKDSTAPQLPASTAKLLTGTALLTSVDPTSKFVTKVVKGDQEGDISGAPL